jgi:hypothetical protein
MAYTDYRNHDSLNLDDTTSERDEVRITEADTSRTSPTSTSARTSPTMACTTTTTTTNTRPSTSTANTSRNQSNFRGENINNIYRPFVAQPGGNQTGFGMPRQQVPPQVQGDIPQAQGAQQPFYMDPGFVQFMTNTMNQAIDRRLPNGPPPVSPINHAQHDDGHRTSTPNSQDGHNRSTASRGDRSPTNLTQGFANLNAGDPPRIIRPATINARTPQAAPAYIPAAEQALEIHQNAANAAQSNADVFSGVAHALQLMARAMPNAPPEMNNIVQALNQKAMQSSRDANLKNEGLRNARRVAKYYETPIMKPAYPIPDSHRSPRVNYKELLMLTGYFDPNDKSHDFKHTWQKLLDYGSLNEFQEEQYMQALGSILKNEAYENFIEFKATNKPLEEILDYFAGVYTKKRSLVADRKAVDEFTRKKGESIVVCMERAILAIDKLKHLHDPSGWPALRQQMRHNILMQVVKEETKRAVQMEVDHVYEDTGMPYDFEKLIRFADRYERNHNAAPKDEVTTLFKVASGGIHKREKRSSSQDQLAHLKKEQMLQKKVTTLESELNNLKSNEARLYKNEGRSDRSRENRRSERDSRSRDSRSKSYDRSRNLSSSNTSRPTTPSQTRPPVTGTTPTASTYQPPDPYKRRDQSQSPGRRGQTPNDPYRARSTSENRSSSQSRYRNRSNSNSRYKSSSDSRYKSSSDSKPHSRSGSSKDTDRIMSTGSKTVIITINGQDYVPLRKEN